MYISKTNSIYAHTEFQVCKSKRAKGFDLTFKTQNEFEKQIEETHKTYKCEVSGKTFLLSLRPKSTQTNIQENLRCATSLPTKGTVPFMNWMQILHVGVNYDVQDQLDETVEEEISVNINQCHICCLKLASRNKVMDHVEKIHVEYFQGVMEIAARNRTEI